MRETEVAERLKAVDLVEARRAAEREAIKITVQAEAEKAAALDEAESIRTLADAEAGKLRISAEADADAEKLRVAAAELRYAVEAAGRRAMNDADNTLTSEIVEMKVKLAIVEHLRDIIRESVRPIENIDGIKIVQVDGLSGGNGAKGWRQWRRRQRPRRSGGLADQVVSSALQYRSQAPLIDAIMKEIGLSGSDLNGLVSGLSTGEQNGVAGDAPTDRAPTAAE